jgi:hypothetical protein
LPNGNRQKSFPTRDASESARTRGGFSNVNPSPIVAQPEETETMNFPLSSKARRRLVVDLGDYFAEFSPIRSDVTGKHSAPFSKRNEGRNRRNQRRQAIARKREFLA